MKQCHLLSIFICVLLLKFTSELNSRSQSINEILKEIYKSEGDEKEREFLASNEDENNLQTEYESLLQTNMKTNRKKPYLPAPNNVVLQGWFTINSHAFGNHQKFPELYTKDGKQVITYTKEFNRINPQWAKGSKIPSNLHFYFRLSPGYLYYSFNEKDLTVAGSIPMKNMAELNWLPEKKPCIIMKDGNNDVWTMCGGDEKLMTTWFCSILKLSGLLREDQCDPKNYIALNSRFIIKTITQPLIIIPLPSKHCNTNWDYLKKGSDWECLCKEGKEQSPIDLPPPNVALFTDVKPLFEYDFVDPVMTEDYGPANVKTGEKISIRHEDGALRIKHPNFGKIVTLDGAVYIAQEIVFHTPSEHTIEGNRYDMEMQIIHNGKTIGDTNKTAIFSVFFQARPGVFNKFIDKLDFFDLPNPLDKVRELSNTLYIPHVFLSSEEENISIVNPFSFYTYQGSISVPPCVEQTIHYIASSPINLSNTAIELFKEALRLPDRMDAKGNVITSNSSTQNNRAIQPLNGRSVFHYDHTKFNCPDLRIKPNSVQGVTGHYERRIKESTEYLFINGNSPSGMPGSFVVSEHEATGN